MKWIMFLAVIAGLFIVACTPVPSGQIVEKAWGFGPYPLQKLGLGEGGSMVGGGWFLGWSISAESGDMLTFAYKKDGVISIGQIPFHKARFKISSVSTPTVEFLPIPQELSGFYDDRVARREWEDRGYVMRTWVQTVVFRVSQESLPQMIPPLPSSTLWESK